MEMSVRWLSEDVVSFRVKLQFTRNLLKCNSGFDFLHHKQRTAAANYSIDVFAGH